MQEVADQIRSCPLSRYSRRGLTWGCSRTANDHRQARSLRLSHPLSAHAPRRDSFLRRAWCIDSVTPCRSMGSAITACRAVHTPCVAGLLIGDADRYPLSIRFPKPDKTLHPPRRALRERGERWTVVSRVRLPISSSLICPTLLSTVTCSTVSRQQGGASRERRAVESRQ